MTQNDLFLQWLSEEQAAYIHGWDFSHIQDRYEECQSLPWDYGQAVHDFLRPTHRILDMDTGGGEFLLSLGHPHSLTAATEGYPPNIALCRKVLLPLGIDFRGADGILLSAHLVFWKEISRKISRVQEIRHAGDYDDFYIQSKSPCHNLSATKD